MKTKLWHSLSLLALWAIRLVLSVTFLFSGVVKLIDPRGTQYKIEDYIAAFGLSLPMPEWMPLLLACLLATVEFLIGIHLLCGIRRRLTTTATLCFMLLATPLTLFIAMTNPVRDCGCFGDALVLTNWQTLGKNIVLLFCAAVACYHYRRMTRLVAQRSQWLVSLYSFVFAILFMGYNLWRLPVIDFRPYHVGADIRKAWQDDQQSTGKFVTTFILEKDGERKEFSLEEYPDSTWTFIDAHTVQVEVPQHTGVGDLSIKDFTSGEDVTEDILNRQGYTFLLVSPYLERADDGVMGELLSLYDYSQEAGYGFICLTSSGEKAINTWREMTGAEYSFFLTDAVVLKTMIRSNPGLILLHGGKVAGKWPSTALPSPGELKQEPHGTLLSTSRRAAGIACWYAVPLLILLLVNAANQAANKKNKHRK